MPDAGRVEQFGKYQLLRKLGVGGMAEVYLARTTVAQNLSKLLVIKKIHPAFARSPHFVTMFVDEAKIVLGLNHPNIVQVFDFGHVGPSYYLAMEHVEGLDLMRLMETAARGGRRFPYGLAAWIVEQFLRGLDYAHRKCDEYGEPLNIVHRDVSPHNVLVSNEGAVKIVDFGIARARDSQEEEGVVKGKFAYMSPEQAAGHQVDRRSDIFSAGIVLYELASGRSLFGGLRGGAALEAIRNAAIPRPREIDPEMPETLEAIILGALAARVEERFQWARDMQAALSRFVYSVSSEQEIYDAGVLSGFVARVIGSGERSRTAVAELAPLIPSGPLPVVAAGAVAGASVAAAAAAGVAVAAGQARIGGGVPEVEGVASEEVGGLGAVGAAAGVAGGAAPGVAGGAVAPAMNACPPAQPAPAASPVGVASPRSLAAQAGGSGPAGEVGSDEGTPASFDAAGMAGPVPEVRERKNAIVLEGIIGGLVVVRRQVGEARTRQAVADFLRVAEHIIYKHEAHPDRVDESGMACILGLPVASEDDAARAIRLALALREALAGVSRDLGASLSLSVGIQRGVALVRRNVRAGFDYQLAGAVAHLAQRLAQEAMAGEVLVGGGVFRAARDEWRFDELPVIDMPADVVEASAPTTSSGARVAKVYRLSGPKDRAERLRERRQAGAGVVGRELELKALGEAYRVAVGQRLSRYVAILGEAGVGKRSLVAAFARGLDPVSHVVLHAAARPSAANSPYALIADLVRDFLGVGDGLPPRELRARLQAHIGLLFAGRDAERHERSARDLEQTLAKLVGLRWGSEGDTLEPGEQVHQVQMALRRLFDRLARERTLVVIAEDLHWADALSLEIFHRVAVERHPRAILYVATSRPFEKLGELLASPAVTALQLEELGAAERLELVLSYFAEPEEARELAVQIVAKAGGNVFMIREILEALTERGTLALAGPQTGAKLCWVRRDDPIQVPTSVEGLVSSRLDSLAVTDKEVLTRAAVVGSGFSVDDVDTLLGRSTRAELEQLVGRGLLDRLPGGALGFRNQITEEVAYRAIPVDERRELHRRFAARLESAAGHRAGFDDAVVAHHLEQAGMHSEAGRRYVAAAMRARDASGNVEAFRLLGRALELLPNDAAARFEVHRERETMLRAWAQRAAQLREIQAMRQAAEAIGDDRRLALSLNRLTVYYLDVNRGPQAQQTVSQALLVAQRSGDRAEQAEALRLEATLLKSLGKNQEALDRTQRALALCTADRAGLLLRGSVLNTQGMILTDMGRAREAVAAYAEALVIYRRLGVRRQEAAALANMGFVSKTLGEYEEAVSYYKRSLRLAQEIGDRSGLGARLGHLAHAYLDLGDLSRAQRYLEKARALLESTGEPTSAVQPLVTMGQVHLRRGDLTAARQTLEQGLRLAREAGNRYQEIRALAYLIFALLGQGGSAEQALDLCHAAIRLSREASIPTGEAYGIALEALALAALGRLEQAVARSAEAVALLAGGREVQQSEELLHIHSRLLRQAGRVEEARAPLARAYASVRDKARRLRDPAWRQRFLDATPQREIVADYRALGGDTSESAA